MESKSSNSQLPKSPESIIGLVADEFLERQERGERPNPEEYAARYPEAAQLIRRTLAALIVAGGSFLESRNIPSGGLAIPRVLGDFLIRREIGRGGMGVVYEAEQVTLQRRVAVKVLPSAAVMDPRHLQRFRNEALAAASLDHPNIVHVHAVGSDHAVHYIAMQYVDGRPLSELIRERRSRNVTKSVLPRRDSISSDATNGELYATPQDKPHSETDVSTPTALDGVYIRQLAEWGLQAAEALDHAHSLGVVHRDIKPANLLVDARGVLYIADFGLAKLGGSDPSVTGSGDLLGTPQYMSPEQASARHGLVDHRSDVYSLGVTLYELLTLTPPFGGDDRRDVIRKILDVDPVPPRNLDRKVPRDLETVVLKCLEKNPNHRYQSAQNLADDLRRFLAGAPVLAKRRSHRERVLRWFHRRPLISAGLLMALLTVLVGLAMWNREQAREAAASRQAAKEADTAVLLTVNKAESLYREGRYIEALAVVHEARSRLHLSGSSELRDRVHQLSKDYELVSRLEEARLEHASLSSDGAGVNLWVPTVIFRTTFEDYGVDISGDESKTVESLRGSLVRTEIAATLAELAFREKKRPDIRSHYWRLAAAVDPNPTFYGKLEQVVLNHDRTTLRQLAADLKGDSLPPSATSLVASVFISAGATNEGIRLLKEGLQIYPKDFWINQKLGLTLLNEHTYRQKEPSVGSESLRYLSVALALRPHFAVNHLNVGHVMESLGRWDESEAAYRRAIALKPGYALAHNRLGIIFIQTNKFAAAEQEVKRALELKPDLGLAYENLGRIYSKKGKLVEAERALRQAIDHQPDFMLAYFHLANVLIEQGKLAEAEQVYHRVIELKPDLADGYRELGNFLRSQRKSIEAERLYRRAIELNSESVWAHIGLAKLLREKGKFPEAINEFRELIRINKNSPQHHLSLAYLLKLEGHFKESLEEYRCGHELSIQPKEAQNSVGQVHEIERIAQWIREAERLGALEDKLPDIISGKRSPADQQERLTLAKMAYYRKFHAASTRLYISSFKVDPKLLSQTDSFRYTAACAAANAGCGRGVDSPSPTENEKLTIRRQTLDWLTDELAGLSLLVTNAQSRSKILTALQKWLEECDLACVRDEAELSRLSAAEQAEWRTLWANVAVLQRRVVAAEKSPSELRP